MCRVSRREARRKAQSKSPMNEASEDSTVQVTYALMLMSHSRAAVQRACTSHQDNLWLCLPLLCVEVAAHR